MSLRLTAIAYGGYKEQYPVPPARCASCFLCLEIFKPSADYYPVTESGQFLQESLLA